MIPRFSRNELSWALYDWANSAFATIVAAVFFPVFLKSYWAGDMAATESTLWLGYVNSGASILVLIMAPVLGAIADAGSHKRRFLLLFALLGIVMTAGLTWVAEGDWPLALMLYGLAAIGFSGGNVFYDALMVDVASRDRYEWISALGYALGYLGGGVLFAVDIVMILNHDWFGLSSQTDAVRVAFVTVAIWWALFSVPMMLWVEERTETVVHRTGLVRHALTELRRTLGRLGHYRTLTLFLVAYWCYIDGVDTIARMAVDYGLAIGLESTDLMLAILVAQLVGFPAALVFGRIGQHAGPKRGIQIALVIYVLVVFWAWRMDETWEFYAMAVMIGLVQGGVQALSRALYGRLVPAGRAGEFFGFYNMLGKFAVVLGPLLVGWTAVVTGDSRAGILAVLILLVSGGILLSLVDTERGEREAALD